MQETEVVAVLRVLAELIGLAVRAYERGEDVSHKDIVGLFEAADRAESRWHDSI